MDDEADPDVENRAIADRWCLERGEGWSVVEQVGRGGTAPVFVVSSPEGERALKIYDAQFSSGREGDISEVRIEQQLGLRDHGCPYLVNVYDGGEFEGRLFLLMSRAPGRELVKCLDDVPRARIRKIVDQIAQACIFLRGKDLCHRDIKSENIFVSEDYEHATLLDISVIRDVHDPVGIGTDHDGQLPIVATARYSPPEYLFRLFDPTPELWNALDVYQLGGLLHDLIMRQPLFEAEYAKSRENRYRFAWIVATVDPQVEAADVDHDLILTARRALDKNWERRTQLRLEDFLDSAKVQEARALEAFGLTGSAAHVSDRADVGSALRRLNDVAEELEERVRAHLRQMGETARHSLHPGPDDYTKIIRIQWSPRVSGDGLISGDITLTINLRLEPRAQGHVFVSNVALEATVSDAARSSSIELPEVADDDDAIDGLFDQSKSVLGKLAADLMKQVPADQNE